MHLGDHTQAVPWRVDGVSPRKGEFARSRVSACLTLIPNLYPNLTDEKVRKFMGRNVEAGGDGNAGDNSVSFAEYVEGGVIVILFVA